jgi:hypothetical protein
MMKPKHVALLDNKDSCLKIWFAVNGPSVYSTALISLHTFTYGIHPFSVVNDSKSLIRKQFLTEFGIMSVDNIVLRY